jgi:hypothetical protein
MGYAMFGNESLSVERQSFKRAELNRVQAFFSRRRDFTVPFSKPAAP